MWPLHFRKSPSEPRGCALAVSNWGNFPVGHRPSADGLADAGVDALDGVRAADGLAYLDVEGKDRKGANSAQASDHSFTIAGYFWRQDSWNSRNRSVDASSLGTV